jgi:hypothetical protein
MGVAFQDNVVHNRRVVQSLEGNFKTRASGAAKIFQNVVFDKVVHDYSACAMQHGDVFVPLQLVSPFWESIKS